MTAEHALVSLVYCSSATHPFSEQELADPVSYTHLTLPTKA